MVSPKVVTTRPNYSSLFRRVQQSALKQTIEKVREKATSKATDPTQKASNNVESGFFESNRTTAAPQTVEKKDHRSKTTFDSAANRTLLQGGLE